MHHLNSSRAFIAMVVLSVTAGGIGGATGCSVVTNTTAIQCRSDNECQALGPEFYGSVCDLSTHTCAKVAEDADLCVTSPGKSANRSCMEKFDGEPAICSPRTHRCVRLKSLECPELSAGGPTADPAALLTDDNAVVVGLVDSLNCCLGVGTIAHYFPQLALEQILQINNGGIPTSGGGPSRPMVLLSCPVGQPGRLAAIARAAKHLTDEVEVPLVIGPLVYDDLNALYSGGLRDHRTPTILPASMSRSDLQALPNPAAPSPLLYKIGPSSAAAVDLYRQLILSELEPRIHSSGVTGDIKVAMITEKALGMRESEELLEKKIEFNGTSREANEKNGNYLKATFPDTTDLVAHPNPEAEISAAIKQVVAFKPHIILYNISINLPPTVLFPLLLAVADAPAFKPYHLDMQAGFFAYGDLYRILVGKTYPWGRVFSWAPHHDQVDLDRGTDLASAVTSRFIDVGGTELTTPTKQNLYDGVFLAAYLISAVGNKPLTAENFAAAIPRLTAKGGGAEVINTGGVDTQAGFAAIRDGRSIDLHGVGSTLDIDPATGSVSFDKIEATCLTRSGKGIPSKFVSDSNGSVGDITACD